MAAGPRRAARRTRERGFDRLFAAGWSPEMEHHRKLCLR